MSETVSRIPTNRSSQSTSQNNESEPDESVRIERAPWSQLAQEFAEVWGRADPSDPQPEHVEDIGPTGSGKTLIMCKMVQERMIVRHTPCVIIQTKPADGTVMRLGWPVITNGDVRRVQKERWSIYWPNTNATGRTRKLYQADAIRKLLDSLWHANSNIIVVFDDFGYIQELVTSDGEPLAPIVQMYLREGRSAGITCYLIKQRPQGSRREMHSETQWTIAFPPKDKDDQERYAELFGDRKTYMAVFDTMDAEKHEFLIKHSRTGAIFISWVDTPLRPVKRPNRDAKVKR